MCYNGRNMELFLNSYVNVLINFTFSYQLANINSCGRTKLASLTKPYSSWTPLSPERGVAQLFAFGFVVCCSSRGAGFQGGLCTGLFTVWHGVASPTPIQDEKTRGRLARPPLTSPILFYTWYSPVETNPGAHGGRAGIIHAPAPSYPDNCKTESENLSCMGKSQILKC